MVMIQKVQEVQEINPADLATADEVAAVFDIVFRQLRVLQMESDTGIGASRREIRDQVAQMKKLVAQMKKEGSVSMSSMKKMLDQVVSWKAKEMKQKPAMEADMQDTMALCDANTADINKILIDVKKIKAKVANADAQLGRIPDHEWNGTMIRFEQPDGTWGEYVNLQGAPGAGGESMPGVGMGGVRRIRVGTGLTISGDAGEPTISASGAGTGVVVSIVAGSGITVDSTDPANPIVSASGAGTGDVVGPGSATDNAVARFDGTTGKLVQNSAVTIADTTGDITAGKYNTVAISGSSTPTLAVTGTSSISGANTGDNATNSQYSGLAASKEDVSNKATTFGVVNDTLYPTVKAVNDAITTAVVGLLDYRGSYDASTNLFPATGGSGVAGAILKGDFYIVSVAGTLGGTAVTAGDLIIALVDTPAQTASNWDLISHDINYVPENAANKVTSISGASTDTQYPSAKLLYDQLALYVTKALFDANTILFATSDNTPAALTVGEQTVVGRATGGAIAALAIDSDLTSVSANDDTVPSAKATKAMGDLKLPLAGGTMSGTITLGENTSIALDPAGSADGKYSGITIAGVGGATIAFGRLVYLKAADSRWWEADADATATAGAVMLGMTATSTTAGAAVTILLIGQIRADASFPALTIGAPVYAGETAGDIQVAIPTGADNVIRVVGFALTADEIYFNPSGDHQITVA